MAKKYVTIDASNWRQFDGRLVSESVLTGGRGFQFKPSANQGGSTNGWIIVDRGQWVADFAGTPDNRYGRLVGSDEQGHRLLVDAGGWFYDDDPMINSLQSTTNSAITAAQLQGAGLVNGSAGIRLNVTSDQFIGLVGDVVIALSDPPAAPPLVPGDNPTNFKNLFAYLSATSAWAKRSEMIDAVAEGARSWARNQGVQEIGISDLIKIGTSVLAAWTSPPAAPPAQRDDDVNFGNLLKYLAASAEAAQKDLQVRAGGTGIGILVRQMMSR